MKYQALLLSVILLSAVEARSDRFVNGQPAASALGQAFLDSNLPGSGPNKFQYPTGVTVDLATGKVFVSDSDNYRILRFSAISSLITGSLPEAVIGQPDLETTDPRLPSRQSLALVEHLVVDGNGRLWVCDSGNNRILCFLNASSRGNNPEADLVFGQPGFDTGDPAASASGMSYPAGVAFGPGDTLWVADTENHRVLRFGGVSGKASGASADSVLGQTNFSNNEAATTASGMNRPYALSVDASGRLWVADSDNHRVLRFDNAASLANGASASRVLGQSLFITANPGITAAGFDSPRGVLAGPDDTLYVADWANGRVLGFVAAVGKTNGAAADFVLGQPGFGSPVTGPSRTLLNGPTGLSLSGSGDLFVADFNDHRVLRFVRFKTPALTILTKPPKFTRTRLFWFTGTAVGEISTVTWRVGTGSRKVATGTNRWRFRAPLKKGRNRITVIASGPGGNSPARTVFLTRK
jgi:sugar lactone lactonase YvrE